MDVESYVIFRGKGDTVVDAAAQAFKRGTRHADFDDYKWEEKVTAIDRALGHYIANFDLDQMAEYVRRTSGMTWPMRGSNDELGN
jgi:hypothetical protein